MHYFVSHPRYVFCAACGCYPSDRLQHIDEVAEALAEVEARHAAHVVRTEDQMTELEQKIVARFRELGDQWFSSLPDGRNTEIGTGDDNTITGAFIKGDGGKVRYPREYHHRLTLSVDKILAAHTLLGIETIGDAIIVGAEVIADRKSDGPVYLVEGMRKYWDQIGWSMRVMMRASDGNWIQNRLQGWSNSTAEIRKSRRYYDSMTPSGVDWDGADVVRDPNPTTHEMDGAQFSHVKMVFTAGTLFLAYVRAPVEITVVARRMRNGKWMIAEKDRGSNAIRDYEAGVIENGVAPLIEDDPEAHLLMM